MIALCMGVVSFDIAMSAALLVYVMSIGHLRPAPAALAPVPGGLAAWRRAAKRLSGRVQVAKPP
jgi:hypothetical protein